MVFPGRIKRKLVVTSDNKEESKGYPYFCRSHFVAVNWKVSFHYTLQDKQEITPLNTDSEDHYKFYGEMQKKQQTD